MKVDVVVRPAWLRQITQKIEGRPQFLRWWPNSDGSSETRALRELPLHSPALDSVCACVPVCACIPVCVCTCACVPVSACILVHA